MNKRYPPRSYRRGNPFLPGLVIALLLSGFSVSSWSLESFNPLDAGHRVLDCANAGIDSVDDCACLPPSATTALAPAREAFSPRAERVSHHPRQISNTYPRAPPFV